MARKTEKKTYKNITITEDGNAVALYEHLIEIKDQNEEKIAHLSVKEEFPMLETDEFDTYDEYYFIDGTMYMQRITAGETNGTSFGSTWAVFWEVVTENLGSTNYNFTESNFTDLILTHNEHTHSMTATAPSHCQVPDFQTVLQAAPAGHRPSPLSPGFPSHRD